jgi:ABC-type amino acid transport substrate-binding protein
MKNYGLPWAAIVIACGAAILALRQPTRTSHATPESSLTRVLREKKLRTAYITYPPTVYANRTTGNLEGSFVDTLREIARQLDPGIHIQFEQTNWADFETALEAGRVDLSIAGTFTTIPRAKRVTFTRPLAYLGRSAVVRRGDIRFSADQGPMQFDRPGIKIGVVDGEGSHEFVMSNFNNLSNIVVFSGADLSQCLAAVSSGQVDVGLSDAMETERYATAHHDVIDLFADHPYDITPIAWAVRHDDIIWKNFLDTAIVTLESQGKLAAFERKYNYRWLQPAIEFRRR